MKLVVYFDGSQGPDVSINIDREAEDREWGEKMVCLDLTIEQAREMAAMLLRRAAQAEKWLKEYKWRIKLEEPEPSRWSSYGDD